MVKLELECTKKTRSTRKLGMHNREVLEDLGVDEADILRMEEREKANKELIEAMTLADAGNQSRK